MEQKKVPFKTTQTKLVLKELEKRLLEKGGVFTFPFWKFIADLFIFCDAN